jgi:hypothetical protein
MWQWFYSPIKIYFPDKNLNLTQFLKPHYLRVCSGQVLLIHDKNMGGIQPTFDPKSYLYNRLLLNDFLGLDRLRGHAAASTALPVGLVHQTLLKLGKEVLVVVRVREALARLLREGGHVILPHGQDFGHLGRQVRPEVGLTIF